MSPARSAPPATLSPPGCRHRTGTSRRGSARPWAPPLGTAAAALAACAAVAAVDPSGAGRPAVCPFYLATGWWCPLCGSTRALHHLLGGDLATAAASNLLLLAAIPVAVYAWAAWASPRLGGPPLPRPRVPTAAWWGLLAVVLAFGAARNLAFGAVLGLTAPP